MNALQAEMEELSSAEEFLDFFGIPYDESVVRVNRLHILQRFHDYLARASDSRESFPTREEVATLLRRAYEDFIHSDARAEKVFKVFRQFEPQVAFVALDSIGRKSA